MAEEILIKIRVDATELEQLKDYVKGITPITEDLKDKFTEAFEEVEEPIKKVGVTLNELKDRLSKMREELGKLPIGSAEFVSLKLRVKDLDTEVKELNKSIRGIDFYQSGREFGKAAIGIAKMMTATKALSWEANENFQALVATVAKGTVLVQGLRGAIIAVTGAWRLWGQAMAAVNKILAVTQGMGLVLLLTTLVLALTGLYIWWKKSTDAIYEHSLAHQYLIQVLEEEAKVLATLQKQYKDAQTLRDLELSLISAYEAERVKIHTETNKQLEDIENRRLDKTKEFALKAKRTVLEIEEEIAKNRAIIKTEEHKKLTYMLQRWDELDKKGRMDYAKQLGIINEETLRFIEANNKEEIEDRVKMLSGAAKDLISLEETFSKEKIKAKEIELLQIRNLEIAHYKKLNAEAMQADFELSLMLAENRLGNSKDLEMSLSNKLEVLKQNYEKERDLELLRLKEQQEIALKYKREEIPEEYGTTVSEIAKNIPEDSEKEPTEKKIERSKRKVLEIENTYNKDIANAQIEHNKFMTALQQQFDIDLSQSISEEVSARLEKAKTTFQLEREELVSHHKAVESLEMAYAGIKNDIVEQGERQKRELMAKIQEAESRTNDQFTNVRLDAERDKWLAIKNNSKSKQEEIYAAEKVFLANTNKIIEDAESKKTDIILKARKQSAVSLEQNFEADLALLEKAGEDKLKLLRDVDKSESEQSKEYDNQKMANIQEQNQLEIDFLKEKEQFMFDIHLEYLDKTARTNKQVKEMQLAEEEKFYKDQLALIEASISTKDEKETAAAEATATHEAVVRQIREEAAAKIFQDVADVAQSAVDLGNTVAGIMDQIARRQEGQDRKEMNALKNKNTQKLNSFKGTEKQKEALNKKIIEEEYQLEVKQMQRREEMAKKQFLITKATAAASAVVNIASAVASALTAGPGVGIALSVITAILGAVQLATILSAKFDDSNYNVEVPSMPSGGAGGGSENVLGPTLAFGQSGKQPETVFKTYVIGSEVSTQLALDRQTLKNGLLV